jgi:DNA-binding Xre family transcriptional regulator
MIRTDREYNELKERMSKSAELLEQQREQLESMGLTKEQVKRALGPTVAFQKQQLEELEFYERLKDKQIPKSFYSFNSVGTLLVAGRIARGWTQKELAEQLGVSESVVSRDEKNEYHGITAQRAARICDVLHLNVKFEAELATV